MSSARTRPFPASPAPSASVFPPAPAQASSTRPPGGGATSSATSWLPSSITSNSPSRNAESPNALTRVSNVNPTGDSGVGFTITCSSANVAVSSSRETRAPFTRIAIGAR